MFNRQFHFIVDYPIEIYPTNLIKASQKLNLALFYFSFVSILIKIYIYIFFKKHLFKFYYFLNVEIVINCN